MLVAFAGTIMATPDGNQHKMANGQQPTELPRKARLKHRSGKGVTL
jgi:hypothetical protein